MYTKLCYALATFNHTMLLYGMRRRTMDDSCDVTAPKICHSRSEQYLKQLMLLRGNVALIRQPCHYRYSRYRQHIQEHDLDRCQALIRCLQPVPAWHYLRVVM
jgi:hypothetical protein